MPVTVRIYSVNALISSLGIK